MIDYRKLTTKDKCLSSVASYVEFESSYRQDIYWIQICQKCHSHIIINVSIASQLWQLPQLAQP